MVLRSVRTEAEGAFVPHLSLTVGLLLAFVCVATLVFFVGHMSGRINVDTVIELVADDVRLAIQRLTGIEDQPQAPPAEMWRGAAPVADTRRGYLQQLHVDGLADWAAEQGTVLRLLVRPGDYVFPGAPIALMIPAVKNADAAVRAATALGPTRSSSADLEFAVRQLVEVAVRALSPGINDPHTAIAVLDRLGSALCDCVPVRLRSGVSLRNGRAVLVVPAVDYDGLADGMFHMIRQNGGDAPAVLVRMLEVLTAVISCEHAPPRVATLRRHADLVLADAERTIANRADLGDIRARHAGFEVMRLHGVAALAGLDDN